MLYVFMCFCIFVPSGWYGRLPDLYMLNVVVEDQIKRDCEHLQHDEIMPKRGRASCEVIQKSSCMYRTSPEQVAQSQCTDAVYVGCADI